MLEMSGWAFEVVMPRNKNRVRINAMFGGQRSGWPCAVLLLLWGGLAFSQTASISGTVLDSSGAGVPDARVTATHAATGLARFVQTAASGAYALTNLVPGKYILMVEKAGFATAKFEAFELTVAQSLTLNASLELGTVN